MPIFEFVCKECELIFEELIFGFNTDNVVCPSCGGKQVRKKMSTFASTSGSDGASPFFGSSATASCSTGSV
jgi:putative FmdB family regulatory protein